MLKSSLDTAEGPELVEVAVEVTLLKALRSVLVRYIIKMIAWISRMH